MSKAQQALAAVELSERAGDLAFALSHGEQRQLEIAMCLATEPQLLLLDEPLAGMGAEESLNMVDLIKQLSATHAVLLVEHDMDAVFQLAQVLTVMVDGRLLASGSAEQIRADRDVQVAYLGEREESAMSDRGDRRSPRAAQLLRRKPYLARHRFRRPARLRWLA